MFVTNVKNKLFIFRLHLLLHLSFFPFLRKALTCFYLSPAVPTEFVLHQRHHGIPAIRMSVQSTQRSSHLPTNLVLGVISDAFAIQNTSY